MTVPDSAQISEVLLFAEGFQTARQLGRKLVALFSLAKQLLSRQQHYDWGLRATKSALRSSGKMLALERRKSGQVSAQREAELVVQGVRANTISKLTFDDLQQFNSICFDVFNGVNFKEVYNEELTRAMLQVCEELKLSVNQLQLRKALELKEQLDQRMGVVIVGPSGSGKSTLWNLLKAALIKQGKNRCFVFALFVASIPGSKLTHYVMNPKAMVRHQLLGFIDEDTREWSDGVLTYSARQVVKEGLDTHSWIICDGDIDPEWIESLNSVLDDNRLLTMPSGERIQFSHNVNFIFETHDLSSASPATISRMGMIFLGEEDTDVKAIVSAWLNKQKVRSETEEASSDTVLTSDLVERYFYQALQTALNEEAFVIKTSVVGVVKSALSLLEGCHSVAEFSLALIRGLGANLAISAQEKFARYVFNLTGTQFPSNAGSPVNSYLDADSDMVLIHQTEAPQITPPASFRSLPVIPTINVRHGFDQLETWLRQRQPILFAGPEGCGKSFTLNCSAAGYPTAAILTFDVNLSLRTFFAISPVVLTVATN